MSIAIFGTGGVGGYFGGRLAEAGEPVTFIARGAHLAAIKARGLRVRSIAGDFTIHPARATDDPAAIGPVDVVLLAVKAWQLPEAAAAMRPLVGPGTMVVPLLNGVEAPAQLAEVLGRDPVVGGLCRVLAFVHAPGEIHHTAIDPLIECGELDRIVTPRVEAFRRALARCRGVTATIPADIHLAMWQKYLFIAPVSAVGALTGKTIGQFRRESRVVLTAALEEVALVGRALGVALPEAAVANTLAYIDTIPEGSTTSMQRDIMEGKPSELEAQVGAVVRLAESVRVPVPTHRSILEVLRPREQRARGASASPPGRLTPDA